MVEDADRDERSRAAPQTSALDLDWTDWVPLRERFGLDVPPPTSGLYRIRSTSDQVLAYIGQTGRSLRERLGSLRAVYGPRMPYRDPHTVGPALWAWVQADGVELEVSTRAISERTPQRKALEAMAIAQHRQLHGVSPRWNFGRMPRGFRMSSGNNARLTAAGERFRGGPSKESLPSHEPGIAPLAPLDASVQGPRWCGHAWSDWRSLAHGEILLVGAATGLYRLRGNESSLVYVGEGKVRDRLVAHAKKLAAPTAQGRALAAAGPIEFSVDLNASWLRHQRLELETDLIAAHMIAFHTAPAVQFIG